MVAMENEEVESHLFAVEKEEAEVDSRLDAKEKEKVDKWMGKEDSDIRLDVKKEENAGKRRSIVVRRVDREDGRIS